MKYYIISGEASGDLHGSNLVKELKKLDHSANMRGWGGDLMQEQGVTLVKHFRDLAFMGFAEVLMNIRTILKNIDFCKKDILEFKPDVLILIDYPGFNLRIAKFAHQHGIKVFYYISPSVWAWKESREKLIKAVVDKMFVILPFEKAFYQKHNYQVDFVGHPLLDAMENQTKQFTSFEEFVTTNKLSGKPIIAILPGSRKQEIAAMLPVMTSITEKFPDYEFIIAGAPSLPLSYYQEFTRDKSIKIIFNKTYEILHHAHSGLIKSGTSTLEAALLNVPQVVCYKANPISIWIGRRLVKIKFFSLVNLIMNEEVVKELLQEEMNETTLVEELKKVTYDTPERKKLIFEYDKLKNMLGGLGASKRLAELMYTYIQQNKFWKTPNSPSPLERGKG